MRLNDAMVENLCTPKVAAENVRSLFSFTVSYVLS